MEFAEKHNLDRTYLSKIESGKMNVPSRAQVEKLIELLGPMDIDERMGLLLAAGHLDNSDVATWAEANNLSEQQAAKKIVAYLQTLRANSRSIDDVKPHVLEALKEIIGEDVSDQAKYLVHLLSASTTSASQATEVLTELMSAAKIIMDQLQSQAGSFATPGQSDSSRK